MARLGGRRRVLMYYSGRRVFSWTRAVHIAVRLSVRPNRLVTRWASHWVFEEE